MVTSLLVRAGVAKMQMLKNGLFGNYLHGTSSMSGAVSGMLCSLRSLMLLMRESGAALLLCPSSIEVPYFGHQLVPENGVGSGKQASRHEAALITPRPHGRP
jgi:hypothetical protein